MHREGHVSVGIWIQPCPRWGGESTSLPSLNLWCNPVPRTALPHFVAGRRVLGDGTHANSHTMSDSSRCRGDAQLNGASASKKTSEAPADANVLEVAAARTEAFVGVLLAVTTVDTLVEGGTLRL